MNKEKEMSSEEIAFKLYAMKLGEVLICYDWVVTRVPGGWLYTFIGRTTFVPFNNEFQK